MNYRVVIPSKGRATTISTHLLFKNTSIDYKIFVHNEQEYNEYLKNPTIQKENLINTNTAYGISNIRQWIITNYIKPDEWFITMDDNIKTITALSEPHYSKLLIEKEESNKLKEQFSTKINIIKFMELLHKDIEFAKQNNIHYGGFAVVDNPYFRTKKYRFVGYVISKMAFIHNNGINYDPKIVSMDDYGFTAENLLKYGKVLINNYIFPIAGHYEKGGIGTYEERKPKKIIDCTYLMQKYPLLFRYNEKSYGDKHAEIMVRFYNIEQINKWQKFMEMKHGMGRV
jgi:hypothetical protein